jgi:hypothetical protein
MMIYEWTHSWTFCAALEHENALVYDIISRR